MFDLSSCPCQQKENFCLSKVLFLFIQATGLAYHHDAVVYIIKGALRPCISLRLDDIQPCGLMIYRNKLRMIYKAYALIYLQKHGIIKSSINKNLTGDRYYEKQMTTIRINISSNRWTCHGYIICNSRIWWRKYGKMDCDSCFIHSICCFGYNRNYRLQIKQVNSNLSGRSTKKSDTFCSFLPLFRHLFTRLSQNNKDAFVRMRPYYFGSGTLR